jgi:alpha-mannosidase
MCRLIFSFLSLVVVLLSCLPTSSPAQELRPPPDLSKDRVLYTVGYAHLDTQWRWGYPIVVRRFIANTMWDNFRQFEKYPEHIFNFSGAFRYEMMKEYYPKGYAELKDWVKAGRWFPAGSSWEENDVMVPSSESLLRQLLYGHRFFEREFGVASQEYMLPDCFGFPASLPSVLAHCGIRGFSTQKLTWGSAKGIPFNLGVWEGLDGESVIAALNCGKYDGDVTENLALSEKWRARLDANGAKGGVFADLMYYGVGDRGGAPTEPSIKLIEEAVATKGPVRVVSVRADQIFRDITDEQKAGLPKYQGDLLLTEHSAGSITSQAYMKRWNRMNETLAEAAEKASVAAHLLGATPYPREKINRAWGLVLAAQMHDILPGTSLPKCYEYSWNDEIIALNSFASVLENAVGGVARALDTQVGGVPLVVYNPLSIAREDVVEAEVELPAGTTGVTVFDGAGKSVPTQVLAVNGAKHKLLFLAQVPSIGFSVFDVRPSGPSAIGTTLQVSDRQLENARYRVTINDAGDIGGIFDKAANREMLAAPARLAFQTEIPHSWPAWNMDWKDRTNAPRSYLSGPAKIRIVERGPVRVAIEIERESENSIFVQTVRLAAGEAGGRIEVANQVDWQSKACSLKAEFPLTVSNPLATYNWEIGKIQRGNNERSQYEVPSRQWFDLTDASGDYGVSILTGAKYGSDKPNDHTVRLTLLYTPGVRDGAGYDEQQTQDWGRHEFIYGLSGHQKDWRAGQADWQAARLEQPLLAFRTTAHPGQLGCNFSLLQTSSDQVAVRTVKLAEDNDRVIIRVQELNGTAAPAVDFTTKAGFSAVSAINGLEREAKALKLSGKTLALDFKPYQLRSVAATIRPPAKLAAPKSQPVKLPYNLDAFSYNDYKQDGSCDFGGVTIPAEMIGDVVEAEGIKFQIGPRSERQRNAIACEGQVITLPRGNFNRLYLLATAVNSATEGDFVIGGRTNLLRVQDWSGYIGSWDNRIFQGAIPEITYSIKNPVERIAAGFIYRDSLAWFASHRHLRDGTDEVYKYSYLFKYALNLPPGATTVTLPNNPRIRIIAMTAAQNDNDATAPVQPLYDDFTGRQAVILRAAN